MIEYQIHELVTAFTTTREGGCSIGNYAAMNVNIYCGDNPKHVETNRELLCQTLHISTERLVMPHQTHDTRIAVIDDTFLSLSVQQRSESLEGIDALITDQTQVAIGVSTADCVPILIYDYHKHIAAAIHAGWRGTVKRITEHTLQQMHDIFGTDGKDCKAVIGPSISLDNFEVGDEVYEMFSQSGFDMKGISCRFPAKKMSKQEGETTKWHIDLWECNRRQLMAHNIDAHNIQVAGICTYDHADQFFSARKLGILSGRLLTGIILR